MTEFSDGTLLAYLDEGLPVDEMADVERALRASEELRRHAALLAGRRDQGGHSVGDVWRRRRLSCPDRGQLGSYLLDALEPAVADYVTFHLSIVGCRYCQANLRDLELASVEGAVAPQRRRRYFESSAGLLQSDD